jgi:hypothetical protein
MHYLSHLPILVPLLQSRLVEAGPVPQVIGAPCPTTVLLPEATLTVSPGPSSALVNGLPNGATSTLKVDGPAITIGASVLSLNKEGNLNLDNQDYLFASVCPALLIPVTTPNPVAGDEPESSSSIFMPAVPGATDTPSDDNNDGQPNIPAAPIPVPSTPTAPDAPGVPDTPEGPSPPEAPNTPNTPDSPSNPSDPDVPNTPDNPASPNIPAVPDTPPGPIIPVITPPPTPPGIIPTNPDSDEPKECETKSASICIQGCSFGVNGMGITTTTSCANPSCAVTAGCTVSGTTSTTTFEPETCSLEFAGVAKDYPFEIGGDGPLPVLRTPVPGAPVPANPKPTPEPDPPAQSEPGADEPVLAQPPQNVYEVREYVDIQGVKYSAIFQRNRDSSIDLCNDSPLYAANNLQGSFDLPQSYPSCTFVGIGGRGPEDWGIFCNGHDKLSCVLKEPSSHMNCAGDMNISFDTSWVCNE